MKLAEVLKIKSEFKKGQEANKTQLCKDVFVEWVKQTNQVLYMVKVATTRTGRSASIRAYIARTVDGKAHLFNVTSLLSEILGKPLTPAVGGDVLQITTGDQRLSLEESFLNYVNTLLGISPYNAKFTSAAWL